MSRFQHIQNSLARAVVRAPISLNVTPVLQPFHWRKINKRIENYIFTARRYASAVLAVIVCPSVRLSVCPSVRHKSELYKDG